MILFVHPPHQAANVDHFIQIDSILSRILLRLVSILALYVWNTKPWGWKLVVLFFVTLLACTQKNSLLGSQLLAQLWCLCNFRVLGLVVKRRGFSEEHVDPESASESLMRPVVATWPSSASIPLFYPTSIFSYMASMVTGGFSDRASLLLCQILEPRAYSR